MYGTSAKYKLHYDASWYDSSWVCVLKRKGIRVEGRGTFPRTAIWRANREMKKAIKLKARFETFKSQVCE